MAKGVAICTCSVCGKEFRVEKRNCLNTTQARNWEDWAKDYYDTCNECWKEQCRQYIADEAKEMHMPELIGSEKQVSWAVDIRHKAIASVKECLRRGQESFDCMYAERGEEFLKTSLWRSIKMVLQGVLDTYFPQQTEARWWIDHRYHTGLKYAREYAQVINSKPETDAEIIAREAAGTQNAPPEM